MSEIFDLPNRGGYRTDDNPFGGGGRVAMTIQSISLSLYEATGVEIKRLNTGVFAVTTKYGLYGVCDSFYEALKIAKEAAEAAK